MSNPNARPSRALDNKPVPNSYLPRNLARKTHYVQSIQRDAEGSIVANVTLKRWFNAVLTDFLNTNWTGAEDVYFDHKHESSYPYIANLENPGVWVIAIRDRPELGTVEIYHPSRYNNF